MERFCGIPLKRINSMTKFPSIPTLHVMGEKGRMKDEIQVDFIDCAELVVTEKIDGTNCRVIIGPNHDFIIGSREELLYAKGDLIINKNLGIVDHILPIAHKCAEIISIPHPDMLWVFYFEVFGGNITNYKNYTSNKQFSSRLIDGMCIDIKNVKAMELNHIAEAREDLSRTFQKWVKFTELSSISQNYGLSKVPEIALTDREQILLISNPPVRRVLDIMENIIPKSLVALDDKALKQPEGLILRDNYKKKIAKMKFKEYKKSVY